MAVYGGDNMRSDFCGRENGKLYIIRFSSKWLVERCFLGNLGTSHRSVDINDVIIVIFLQSYVLEEVCLPSFNRVNEALPQNDLDGAKWVCKNCLLFV